MKTFARERDKTEVLQRLGGLRQDTARRWGHMSAHQMVCHLCDGYRMLTGDLPTALVSSPLPRPVMKCVALYVPLRWPRNIQTTAELDQRAGGGTQPVAFDADVAALTAIVRTVTSAERGRFEGRVHPIFGRMSEPAWMRWAYLHADHHLRQFGL